MSHPPVRSRTTCGLYWPAITAFSGAVLCAGSASALPSFAQQTGQPCAACHVGALGPQLTPFGRAFKLGGYTLNNGQSFVPVSAMAIASYLKTAEAQASPPAPGYSANNNFAFDEGSIFLAGGFGDHLGAFVQATYEGVAHHWGWDNLDLRATFKTEFAGADTIFGVSINNNPTIQDAWNSTPGWGFPYTDSGLAPSPAAAPLIAGGLGQSVLGASVYAWWDDKIYAEAGLYKSLSVSALDNLGVDPAETSKIDGAAPYVRLAYQDNWGDGVVSLGAFFLAADLFPGRDETTGTSDSFDDYGLDATYQLTRENNDVFSLNGRFVAERQDLAASQILGDSADRKLDLYDLRADASYYFGQQFGVTAGVFKTWGDGDPLLYASNRTLKPDSAGYVLQVDATPFGKEDSWLAPFVNVRVGVQYTGYTEFDGASRDYDGTGRDASDNNTLRVFAWTAF